MGDNNQYTHEDSCELGKKRLWAILAGWRPEDPATPRNARSGRNLRRILVGKLSSSFDLAGSHPLPQRVEDAAAELVPAHG